MKSSPTFSLVLACLSACGLAVIALPASAERVSSERSKIVPTASAPLRWHADGIPSKQVARLQYRDMPIERIFQVQKRNNARRMKPVQVGIGRVASTEGVAASLPPLNWISRKDGSSVARIEVRSPVALAVRVGLRVDALDPRAELRFAGSTEPSRVVAAMSGSEILKLAGRDRIFWTPSTDGEIQFIEVYLPKGTFKTSTRLQAPQLSHLLADSRNNFKIVEKIGESDSCNVDTACRIAELGTDFVSAKNAVAHMQFIVAGDGYICTGTLLADTVSTSQIPYFYSANHCIDNQTVASTLNTFWKMEATSCNSGVQGVTTQLAGGAVLLYSDPDTNDNVANAIGTDALLLRLNNTPPAGSEFAGWDSAALAASSNIIGIHHPSGDVKKVSSGQKVSNNAYQNVVGWLSGTTEGGSSGSGLFTADATGYHLRGGLYGGGASCANTGSLGNAQNRDYYSRFDLVFPHVSQWLAPTPTNVAPTANFTSSTSGKVITFTDASTDSDGTIASRLWTFGDGTTSTATNPVKTYATLGVYSVTLKVTDNGGLSHSVTRSVSTTGRARVHGSQPRIPGQAAPAAQPATTPRTGKVARTKPLEP